MGRFARLRLAVSSHPQADDNVRFRMQGRTCNFCVSTLSYAFDEKLDGLLQLAR